MSKIVQYFTDKFKTTKEYPITLTKAIYDANGNRLDIMLDKIVNTPTKVNIPFTFCNAWNIIDSWRYEKLYSLDTDALASLNNIKSANVNKCCITVEIQPSADVINSLDTTVSTLDGVEVRMFPDAETLTNYIQLAKDNGIEIYNIKFHFNFIRDLENVSVEEKMALYEDAVLQALSEIGYEFEYISVCNEAPTCLSYSGLLGFLRSVKNYGKVLLSGIQQTNITDEMINVVDGYCPHWYVGIGKMGSLIDVNYAVNRFKDSKVFENMYTWCKRSDKPIIVGEFGCMSSYNALAYPERWGHTDETDDSGYPQILYISAFIETMRNIPQLKYASYWWTLVGNTKNFVKEYHTGGM